MGCASSSPSSVAQDKGAAYEAAGHAVHDRHHRQSSALILMSEDNRATADQRMMLRARKDSKSAVLRTISTGWHKGENYVVRIAITGGPSGGKGQATELITRKLTQNGFNVHPLPSAHLLLFNSGFSVPSLQSGTADRLHYEKMVLELQLQQERTWAKIAAGSDTRSVILVSQGLMSGRAHLREEHWQRLLADWDTDENYIFSRYDQVIHLETAANGAESRFHAKAESMEEARMMDRAVRRSWAGHKNHIVCENSRGWDQKMVYACEKVLDCAQSLSQKKSARRPSYSSGSYKVTQ